MITRRTLVVVCWGGREGGQDGGRVQGMGGMGEAVLDGGKMEVQQMWLGKSRLVVGGEGMMVWFGWVGWGMVWSREWHGMVLRARKGGLGRVGEGGFGAEGQRDDTSGQETLLVL